MSQKIDTRNHDHGQDPVTQYMKKVTVHTTPKHTEFTGITITFVAFDALEIIKRMAIEMGVDEASMRVESGLPEPQRGRRRRGDGVAITEEIDVTINHDEGSPDIGTLSRAFPTVVFTVTYDRGYETSESDTEYIKNGKSRGPMTKTREKFLEEWIRKQHGPRMLTTLSAEYRALEEAHTQFR